ncbi:MAG: O-methyltransferase [Prevotellaceae bacterium]|jgi:predicted O-methyltransferase YrrM|nr:O-methyltransferase [Prevotellaceae bacterium]
MKESGQYSSFMMDKALNDYVLAHTSEEDELLRELTRTTHLRALHPRMLSGHLQGKLLEMLSKMIAPKKALEIGTFTGYSAICIAKGIAPGGMLHTIEINDELTDLARQFVARSSVANKITIHEGDALSIIPKLTDDFDLIFIDGDKREYLQYYIAAKSKLRKGGYILADNVLWDGKITEEIKNNDRHTSGIASFNDYVAADPEAETLLLPVRDGIMICKINN